MFFGLDEPETALEIEQLASRFNEFLIKPNSAVVIRCGSMGCYSSSGQSVSKQSRWFPAYHNKKYPDFKIVDPTGGGNTFVGGFAAGYVGSNHDLNKACIYGNVAASFAIEQIGVPQLTHDTRGELWNGIDVKDRLKEYERRLGR